MRQQVFSGYTILFLQYAFSLIKKVSLWKSNDVNFIADRSHLNSLAAAEPFSVGDLLLLVVIKGHVV